MNATEWLAILDGYLKPVPTPDGLDSREIVRRAIEFDGPPRLPYSFMDPLESDFVELGVIASPAGAPAAPKGEVSYDAWGVGFRSTGRLIGHAEIHPLADLGDMETFGWPALLDDEKRQVVAAVAARGREIGKYVVGCDLVGVTERLRGLMGYEQMMEAMYLDRERFEVLLDKLTDMTIDVVREYEKMGNIDGFMTFQDWGLQDALQIRPSKWREIFKPRYAKVVDAVHGAGMHYLWHNCGWIMDIIGDMIEIGVDVIQLDQPRLMGHRRVAESFGGKVCFWNMCDIQWSPRPEVTNDDIRADVEEMTAAFSEFPGGLMARHYPIAADIELTAEKAHAIYDAFMDNGCRLGLG